SSTWCSAGPTRCRPVRTARSAPPVRDSRRRRTPARSPPTPRCPRVYSRVGAYSGQPGPATNAHRMDDRRGGVLARTQVKQSPGIRALVNGGLGRVREVSCADVKRRLDAGERFELIDVGEHEEWSRGRLPRARHLCKGIIERDIESAVPDHAAPIVLYCGG